MLTRLQILEAYDVDEDDDVRPHPDIAKTLTHVPAVSLGLHAGRGFVSEIRCILCVGDGVC